MSEETYLRALARYSGDIAQGNIAFDYKTGACGPVQATHVRSWGSACPSGFCPPENLPPALNRWFAGDRAGCREIPYVVQLTGVRQIGVSTVVTVQRNATVTMCPTRIIAFESGDSPIGSWDIATIQFGAVNQVIGGPIPATALATGVHAAVPIVPDCFRAGQPMTFTANLLPDGGGAEGTHSLYLVFIGPMIG